jgi:uncharacterized membrane protein HdeD (DUF308 family)
MERAPIDPQPDGPRMGPRPLDEDDRVILQEEVAISRDEARRLDRRASWALHNWSYMLALGIAAVVFGALLFTSAFGTLSALAWLTGLFLVFMGIVQLATLGRGESRGLRLLGAVVAVVGGLVLLFWPGETLQVLAVVAGVTLLVIGAVVIVSAFRGAREDRLWDATAGAALALLGAIAVAWPGPTITLLGIVMGLIAIVWGVTTIMSAVSLRRAGREWEELRRARREQRDRPRAAA